MEPDSRGILRYRGRCRAVQIKLTGVIDTLSIEAFDGTLRTCFSEGIALLAVGERSPRALPYSDMTS